MKVCNNVLYYGNIFSFFVSLCVMMYNLERIASMLRRIIDLSAVFFFICLLGTPSSYSKEAVVREKIGVIAPLTGDLSQNGLTAKVGLELALQDFQLAYPDTTLELTMEDSESNPSRAAEIIQKFYNQGIRIVIATGSSAEIQAIKPFSDQNGMLVIASTSTAPSLALADSIIRLTPNDIIHAQGMVEYLRYIGVDVVAPIYRNDVFGNDFMEEFRSRFQERGGLVTAGAAYDITAADFSSYTAELAKQIEEKKQSDSSATIAILTVSFGEIYSIFLAASQQPVLSTVNWYGTEDYARDSRIDNDAVARSFALSVGFTHSGYTRQAYSHPYTSITPSSEDLATRALKIDSRISETSLYTLFDSLWIAGLLIRNPGENDVQAIRTRVGELLGYSIYFDLDDNGDEQSINYGFFRYVNVADHPTWALAGSYKPEDFFARPALSYREFVPDGLDKQIRIGLLLSLTGDNATMGKSFARMAEIVGANVSAFLQRTYTANSSVEFVLTDTASDPTIALTKIKEMKEQGIRLVIGPTTSAELKAIADYVNQNEMILVSPCSTAISLAQDDNLFRFALDNQKQAYALAALLIHEGYRNVEGLYRNDAYGAELFSLFSAAFTQLGGRCGAGIPYDPETRDFSGIVKSLENQVTASLTNYLAKQTAALMISFDEGAAILETLVNSNSFLADLRWFGGDGIAANAAVLNSPTALETALQTHLTASISGFWSGSEIVISKSLRGNLSLQLGYWPTTYDTAVYDVVWLFAMLAEDLGWRWDLPFVDIRSEFIAVTNNTLGYRSINTLNENGDSLYGSIDFYRIDSDQASQAWNVYASYLYFTSEREGLVFTNPSGDSSASEWSLYQ